MMKGKVNDREVILHQIVEGQIHPLTEAKHHHHEPGKCYDCNCAPEYVVEEPNGQKWLWCGVEACA